LNDKCVLCRHPLEATEKRTCLACVAEVRRDLDQIDRTWDLLPNMLGRTSSGSPFVLTGGGSYDQSAIPGGDLLVMLADGGHGDGLPSDPPPVRFELVWWCRELGADGPPSSVHAAATWLSTRIGWAAEHHPAWQDMVEALRRLLRRLQQVTHTSPDPEKGPPCPECRETLLRGWTRHGREDDWTCPGCRRVWDEGSYLLASQRAYVAAVVARESRMAYVEPHLGVPGNEHEVCPCDGGDHVCEAS
jgi:hypothetical protein